MARIMIIDDSPTDTHVLEEILRKHGYTTVTATSADEGIETVKDIRPDLILMDVVMPGLNGFQATRELTTNPDTSAIPVILVTRKDQQVDRMWGMRQGARDYLVKPVKETVLMSLISETLAA